MQYEVIIAGGGMVGLALACLLGQAGRRVAVFDGQCPTPMAANAEYDLRVSAISRASQRLVERVGAWDLVLAQRAAAYERMVVWDATGSGRIEFDAAELGEPDLGHIVENQVLQFALLQALQAYPTVDWFCPLRLEQIERSSETIRVSLSDGKTLQGQLLVGADGAQSKVRQLADFAWYENDYGQKGVVCTVETTLPHQATAWQRFMPTGPLAFLPLPSSHTCSIVWSLPADRADEVVCMEAESFQQALAQALDYQLGDVIRTGARAVFSLRGRHAERYVQERIALVGDAAHTIHPLAGQGVNLGFKDAVELAQQLTTTQEDVGSLRVLRRYERARRGDNQLTQKTMEGFKLLFSNTSPLLQVLRNQGLTQMNHFSTVKYALARQAMGL